MVPPRRPTAVRSPSHRRPLSTRVGGCTSLRRGSSTKFDRTPTGAHCCLRPAGCLGRRTPAFRETQCRNGLIANRRQLEARPFGCSSPRPPVVIRQLPLPLSSATFEKLQGRRLTRGTPAIRLRHRHRRVWVDRDCTIHLTAGVGATPHAGWRRRSVNVCNGDSIPAPATARCGRSTLRPAIPGVSS